MTRLATLFRRAADPRADGRLLAAFLADRDEAAFAELIRRHGPLVWGVCRRTLPDLADAEDAFQAAFLVLVRRAARLTGAVTVGPWLYRVAGLTARNLRRKNARRLARTRPFPADVSAPASAASPDLDAVLLALPEKYRAAVVLCRLQGLTYREAADRLGCPEGTVSSLVSRGLAKLRTRLAGREPLAVLAVATVGAVPNELPAAAVRSAVAWRLATLSAAASPAVAELTRGVLRMFWVKKLSALAATGMVLAAGVGVGVGVKQTPAATAADEPKPTARPAATPVDPTKLPQMEDELRRVEAEKKALQDKLGELDQRADRLRHFAYVFREPRPTFPHFVLTVADPRSSAAFTLTEYEAGGRAVFNIRGADVAPVQGFLERVRDAVNWPTRIVVVRLTPEAPIGGRAQAVGSDASGGTPVPESRPVPEDGDRAARAAFAALLAAHLKPYTIEVERYRAGDAGPVKESKRFVIQQRGAFDLDDLLRQAADYRSGASEPRPPADEAGPPALLIPADREA